MEAIAEPARPADTAAVARAGADAELADWLALARETAERLIDQRVARIAEIGGVRTETVIREGDAIPAIERLIAEDPAIGILVLAASASKEGPGPLVTAFASRSGSGALPILITIVPGSMSDEQIVAVT